MMLYYIPFLAAVVVADGKPSHERGFLARGRLPGFPMDGMMPLPMAFGLPLDKMIPVGAVIEEEPPQLAAMEAMGPPPLEAMGGALVLPGSLPQRMGHATEFSRSFSTQMGKDGVPHVVEEETRCENGECTHSKHVRNATEEPAGSQALQGPQMLAGGPDMFPPPIFGGLPLPELLSQIFDGGHDAMQMPMVDTMRLRLRPDHKMNVQPLDHSTHVSGDELIKGELPKGLDRSGLHVEQRGHVVLIRYSLNRTAEGRDLVGVEQQVRLGFQPKTKERAHYDPSTGYFEMQFKKPDTVDFDPVVEIDFGSASGEEVPAAVKDISAKEMLAETGATKQEPIGGMDKKKPAVMIEVGDEL